MTRLIPPIAVPLGAGEILSAARGASADFAAALARDTGCADVRLYGSGKEGLAALFAAWRTPERDEVLLPAYTCWTVPAAAVRAGLRVRVADVDPLRMDYAAGALERVPGARLAAVVGAHLFARTVDVGSLARIARERFPGARVIEDAAQAWPESASRDAAADATVLSFGRGKPLPLGGGGAVLAHVPWTSDPSGKPAGGAKALATFLGTTLLGRPPWFGVLAALPFLGIGATEYDPHFGTRAFAAWQTRLGVALLARRASFVAARAAAATRLAHAVSGKPGWSVPAGIAERGPLRLPLVADSRARRDAALVALRAAGVAASAMYPGTLRDIPALRPYLVDDAVDTPGARALADGLLTLPVYPGLDEAALALIESAVSAT